MTPEQKLDRIQHIAITAHATIGNYVNSRFEVTE